MYKKKIDISRCNFIERIYISCVNVILIWTNTTEGGGHWKVEFIFMK